MVVKINHWLVMEAKLVTKSAGWCFPTYPTLGLAPAAQVLRFYDPQTGAKLLSRYELEQLREALQEENELLQQERDVAQQRAEELAARLRELGVDPE